MKKSVKEKNLKSWKKGQSGNTNGRPNGQRNYLTIRREAFRKIGEARDMTPEEVEDIMVKNGLDKALNGDFKFYADDMDRAHGKPKSAPDELGSESNPLHVKHSVDWGT